MFSTLSILLKILSSAAFDLTSANALNLFQSRKLLFGKGFELTSASARLIWFWNAVGKLALEGSLAERLDQLDKRESELLESLERKNTQIKQLSEEKHRWKRRCEELE